MTHDCPGVIMVMVKVYVPAPGTLYETGPKTYGLLAVVERFKHWPGPNIGEMHHWNDQVVVVDAGKALLTVI